MFSEVFFTGLYSSLIGFILAMGAQCYRSKCSRVKVCCITINRDLAEDKSLEFLDFVSQVWKNALPVSNHKNKTTFV